MQKITLKSLLPFLPLLVLYIVVVLVFSFNVLVDDELRYIRFATNLTHGFFTDAKNPDLGNGPGFPLLLAPFVALNAPLIVLKLLNAFMVITGIIYFFHTLELFTKKKYAIFFAYLIGLYPPLIRFLPNINTESLAFMIICALIFHFFKLYQDERIKWKHFAAASIYLGLLVLVKVIFLHVMGLSILVLGVLFLFKRNRKVMRASLVMLGGFLLIAPYLMYAYSLTGKLFYLGTGGGEILYHRSTPFENELGNWFSTDDALYGANPDYAPSKVYKDLHLLSKNHRDFFLKLEPLSHMEKDSALKAKAIQNIKEHPRKFLKNTVANIGRLLFHYPFSYREQNLNAYGYMIPNMFILGLWLLSIYPFLLRRRNVPFEIKAVMIFCLIYAGAIILLDGRGRNFIIMVPSLVLFFAYVYTNILKISLIKTEELK